MSGLNVGINAAKGAFFDRPKVMNRVSRAKRKVFSKFGAFVRTRARSSMRPARQKAASEMSREELVTFEERKRYCERNGLKSPKRPLAASKPGEPPRVVQGLLKQFLFFAYDAKTESVVIGPAKINGSGNTPEVLEYGGVVRSNGHGSTIAPRPYMRPAFDAEKPNSTSLWANALDGN